MNPNFLAIQNINLTGESIYKAHPSAHSWFPSGSVWVIRKGFDRRYFSYMEMTWMHCKYILSFIGESHWLILILFEKCIILHSSHGAFAHHLSDFSVVILNVTIKDTSKWAKTWIIFLFPYLKSFRLARSFAVQPNVNISTFFMAEKLIEPFAFEY